MVEILITVFFHSISVSSFFRKFITIFQLWLRGSLFNYLVKSPRDHIRAKMVEMDWPTILYPLLWKLFKESYANMKKKFKKSRWNFKVFVHSHLNGVMWTFRLSRFFNAGEKFEVLILVLFWHSRHTIEQWKIARGLWPDPLLLSFNRGGE